MRSFVKLMDISKLGDTISANDKKNNHQIIGEYNWLSVHS